MSMCNHVRENLCFSALSWEHKELFDRVLKDDHPQISEFTFTNLFSWRNSYTFEVSLFEQALLVRSLQDASIRYFPPIGASDPAAVIRQVLTRSPGVFVRVPEVMAAFFINDTDFHVTEDPDNFDYVYLREDLVSLPGRKYDGKRNLIKNCMVGQAVVYEQITSAQSTTILSFEQSWCEIKDCDHVLGLAHERAALQEIVAHFAKLPLRAACLSIAGQVKALIIAEALNPQTVVIHILKADPAITGSYQVMLHEFLKRDASDFVYVNMEQDLGIAGLRKAKQSYHPCSMVKKYTIQLKANSSDGR